ncbi:MAG: glycosyltransferase [Ignisphaera sp.]
MYNISDHRKHEETLFLKKGVIIVFDGSLRSVGGAERFAVNMVKIYEAIGFKAVLLMLGNELKFLRDDRSLIVEVPIVKIMMRSIAFPNASHFRLILQVLKGVDIIHILYCESPIQLLMTFLGRLWGKRVVSSPLASFSFLFHHSRFKALLSIPLIFIKLVIAKLSDMVHVASLYDYRYLRNVNNSIVLIPHSFTIASKLVNRVHKRIFEQLAEYSFSQHMKGIKICFLGRFSEDKGSLISLEALRILRSRGVDVYLIIIGPRIYVLKSLINYARRYGFNALKNILPYVLTTGYLDEETKYRFLKECNVGIIPSISDAVEAFSIALSEFNALGIPVVASAIGALKYRLKPYAGILVKPNDSKALADGVIQALSIEKVRTLPDVITFEQEVILWERALRRFLD